MYINMSPISVSLPLSIQHHLLCNETVSGRYFLLNGGQTLIYVIYIILYTDLTYIHMYCTCNITLHEFNQYKEISQAYFQVLIFIMGVC